MNQPAEPRPGTPREVIPLCSLETLRAYKSRGVELENGSLFLVLLEDGQVRAYRNSCPHLNIELNWQPHGFLDYEQCYIQCKTHGALFRMDDGYCIVGPCSGQSLIPVTVQRAGDWVYLPGR